MTWRERLHLWWIYKKLAARDYLDYMRDELR